MTVLVRDVQFHLIDAEQLKTLLGYAEQDIQDFTRQGTAFKLLKAIIKRKLTSDELVGVVKTCAELSIESELASVRQHCRDVVLCYLMDYPVGDALMKHLEFYVIQLDARIESGRQSALLMLRAIFKTFPASKVVIYAGFFFVPLAMRLVNDTTAACKRLANDAIRELLQVLDTNQRRMLFDMCVVWLQGAKVRLLRLVSYFPARWRHDVRTFFQVAMRKLAALSLKIFVGFGFKDSHLDILLPLLEQQIHPDRYENVRC